MCMFQLVLGVMLVDSNRIGMYLLKIHQQYTNTNAVLYLSNATQLALVPVLTVASNKIIRSTTGMDN